ncbi:UBN2_3 domain-containing protein [Cephalotus follicularis]|uniref:UBN2_3 domain-containing protein n=1 Tax=Cephalotus follicularis TaxID=3775 RepID=A0A1Q3CU30_CEPFO|nr:UBN2_3 domain-containing protein [Cephalotus follicularis]
MEGSNNYQQWRKIVTLVLTGQEKEDHLITTPPKSEPKAKTWLRDYARIFRQLLNSMDNKIVDLVTHIDTVKDLWSYLSMLYSGHNNLSHIYDLSQQFYRVARQKHSLTQYFADFKRMYEELNSPLPITADIKQMQGQREQLAVMSFLRGLGPEYESVEVASLFDTFSHVLRVSRETTQDFHVHYNLGGKSALATQSTRGDGRGGQSGSLRGGNFGGRGSGSGQSSGGETSGSLRQCYYCGELGHVQHNCWKLHGKPSSQPRFANAIVNSDHAPQISQASTGKTVIMSDEEYTC